jgi:hypothetical protein
VPETLEGGGLTPVVRVGAEVRRQVGEWTPGVHALLRYLADVGFDGAPRVLGLDADGREILTFLAGEAARHDDAALAQVARLARRYHDVVAGFEPSAEARWSYLVGAPRDGPVCHNDLSPANTIYGAQGPYAFVDWDLAAPAPVEWDVAHALWRFVPLYSDEDCRRLGFPIVPRGSRLRLFCEAYGLQRPEEILAVARARQLALYETAREWGSQGKPGWAEVWRDTRGEQWLRSMRYLDEHRTEWEQELAR